MMQKSKSSKEEIREEISFADKLTSYPELATKYYLKAIALMMYERRYGKFVSIKEEDE
jgi:hypothetical protein